MNEKEREREIEYSVFRLHNSMNVRNVAYCIILKPQNLLFKYSLKNSDKIFLNNININLISLS